MLKEAEEQRNLEKSIILSSLFFGMRYRIYCQNKYGIFERFSIIISLCSSVNGALFLAGRVLNDE